MSKDLGYIRKGDVAIVWFSTISPIIIEGRRDIPPLSNFVLRGMGATIATGISRGLIKTE